MTKKEKNLGFNWKPLAYYLLIGLFFAGLTILLTWPLLPNIKSAIIGQSNFTDGPFFVWNLWWVKKTLFAFQNPFLSNFVYYPAQVNLTLHTLTLTSGLIYLFLSNFFTSTTSLNLIQLGSIVASAFGMFLLVNYLTKPRTYLEKISAIIPAIIFAFSPYVFSHLMAGHYNLTMLWPIPFTVLFLYKLIRENKIINSYLLAVFLILAGYLDLQILFFTILILFCVFLVEILFNPKSVFNKGTLLYLSIFIGTFLLLFVVPYGLMTYQAWNIKNDFGTFNNADIKILFGPNPLNPLLHYKGMAIISKLIGSYRENVVSLGFIALSSSTLGLLFFAKKFTKEKLTFLMVFIVGMIFLLGPYYQKDAVVFKDIKLPFFYLQNLPFLNIGIVPTRFVVVAYFALAVLSGLALSSIVRFLESKKLLFVASILVIVVCVGIVVEQYSGTMLIDSLPTHQFLKDIANEEGDFTVLPYNSGQRDGFLQTEHSHPVVTGFLGRRIHDHYQAQYDGMYPISKFVRNEADLLNKSDNPVVIRSEFAKYKVRYIVIDKKLQDVRKFNYLKEYLTLMGLEKIYEDTSITVFKLI